MVLPKLTIVNLYFFCRWFSFWFSVKLETIIVLIWSQIGTWPCLLLMAGNAQSIWQSGEEKCLFQQRPSETFLYDSIWTHFSQLGQTYQKSMHSKSIFANSNSEVSIVWVIQPLDEHGTCNRVGWCNSWPDMRSILRLYTFSWEY